VVRPLTAHEFDEAVVNRLDFDRYGLIVAEHAGDIIGFAHAGFGPDEPDGRTHRLDPLLGTVAMLVVDPAWADDPAVGARLLLAAEGYLREWQAQVLYAGGRAPLDPFYRSIYGGSEWSGILDRHVGFHRVVEAAGYAVVARSRQFEIDLAEPEVRDPKAAVLRRQTRLEVVEEAQPAGWWDALAISHGPESHYRLLAKGTDTEIARGSTWDMAAFGRADGRSRVGLRGVEVAALCRRQGFGRYFVAEILRHARGHWAEVVAVATDATNLPAHRLYESLGFRPTGTSSLYRKPGL